MKLQEILYPVLVVARTVIRGCEDYKNTFARIESDCTLRFGFKTLIKYNFWRLRDELVGNYYSDGSLERLAVDLWLLKDYFRFLAGDLSHFSSVSRSVRPLYFFWELRFDLIYSCKLIVECSFLGVSCCCIRWGIRFHLFFVTSKG